MALVNQIKLDIRMELWDIVRFQIAFYCYLNKITVTEQNLDCFTLLTISGETEIGEFCEKSARNNVFKNSQSARTALQFLEKKELITTFKQGKNKKRLKLHDKIIIQAEGHILMNIKVLRVEAPQQK